MFKKVSLSRLLTEIELTGVYQSVLSPNEFQRVFIAGGGRKFRGSENLFLDLMKDVKECYFADKNRSKYPTIVADLASIWSFKENVFDLILSTWVVEHLENPSVFFREAYRNLRKKGLFVCSVPFIQHKHASPRDYYRFTDTSLFYLANSAGFRKVEIKPVGGRPFMCCVSLIWPLFPVPFIGLFFFLFARVLDVISPAIAKAWGKNREILNSYPISYILIGEK